MTGMPTGAQSYIHCALASGMWAQPWLRKAGLNSEPGPSAESGSQLASWMDSPVRVKNVAHCTVVSGYQYCEPFGQGDFMTWGWSFHRTFIGPKSVPKSVTPRMPVVVGLSMTTWPFWKA